MTEKIDFYTKRQEYNYLLLKDINDLERWSFYGSNFKFGNSDIFQF